MFSWGTSSPVSASILRYLTRLPVSLLSWWKLIFSRSDVAGNNAIGHETSDSFRYPFQYARAATALLLRCRLLGIRRLWRMIPESQLTSNPKHSSVPRLSFYLWERSFC